MLYIFTDTDIQSLFLNQLDNLKDRNKQYCKSSHLKTHNCIDNRNCPKNLESYSIINSTSEWLQNL